MSETIDKKKEGMRITAYSLDGREIESFKDVDPSSYKNHGSYVTFEHNGDVITINNAIIVARRPHTFL